jgi:hypothetical protein
MSPSPNGPTASNSADLDVQELGSSYAPQYGRCRFHSQDSYHFDKSAVDRVIKIADAYLRIGRQSSPDSAMCRTALTNAQRIRLV